MNATLRTSAGFALATAGAVLLTLAANRSIDQSFHRQLASRTQAAQQLAESKATLDRIAADARAEFRASDRTAAHAESSELASREPNMPDARQAALLSTNRSIR